MRATKLIKERENLSYREGLKYLNLPTLLYRRLRGLMIKVYRLLSGINGPNIACQLVKPTNFVTRGHYLRFFKRHVHVDVSDYYFGTCIISNWDSLPHNVINVYLISVLDNRLDRFCSNQACS